ncbi:MAG: NAD(P)-dependent oxidoreductase [Bacteroidota bacterium]
MKVLITGSKGVVGQKLVKVLESRGHDVFGIDLQHFPGETGFVQKMSHEKWVYSRCDIGEYRQVERIFNEAGPFDLVYNCAAEFGRWNGEDYYEQVWKTNVIGLKHILRLQEKHHFKLIHFSSSEVYGDYEDIMYEYVMDKFEIKQMNDYALSKWTNEVQIRNSAELYKTETVVVRLFNTYGPGEFYHPYRSVNCKFCYHALMELPVEVFKGHYRSSTYIDDCVETLANISDNFIPGNVYNIGSDQFHDIETLAELIWDYSGASKKLIVYKESEMLTTKYKKVDISNSLRDLKHRSTVELKDGVKMTIDWMKDYYKL